MKQKKTRKILNYGNKVRNYDMHMHLYKPTNGKPPRARTVLPEPHEQTTVRKPDHCVAEAGSTGQSKERAGSGAGWSSWRSK